MGIQEPLSLFHRFESRSVGPRHTPFPHPSSFMQQLSAIVDVLLHIMDRLRNQHRDVPPHSFIVWTVNFPRLL